MNAYSTKQAVDNLGISTSTLRKWCLLLEKEKHTFNRNENNNRIFYDTDLLALRHIKKLTQEEGRTLENAAKDVSIKGQAGKSITSSDMDHKSDITDDIAVTTPHDGYKINQLLELVEKQNEVLSRQEERIDRLDRFDQGLLMELKNGT
jgi:DNA-binding transcriptional MerR regulator